MQVLCPANTAELREMLRRAVLEMDGPVAVRYPRGGDGRYTEAAASPLLREGSDLTIVTYGSTIHDVLTACGHLQLDGYACPEVIKLPQIQPLDLQPILQSVKKTGRILVVEETAAVGCIGREIRSALSELGMAPRSALLNLKNGIVPHGDVKSLRHMMGLDAEGIYQAAKELLHHEA